MRGRRRRSRRRCQPSRPLIGSQRLGVCRRLRRRRRWRRACWPLIASPRVGECRPLRRGRRRGRARGPLVGSRRAWASVDGCGVADGGPMRVGRWPRARSGCGAGQARKDRGELGGCGLRRHAVGQARGDCHARAGFGAAGGEDERDPELRQRVGELEAAVHDADDGVRAIAEGDGAADDARIAGEFALPGGVAEDDDGVRARLLLGLREEASHPRRHAQHRQERRRYAVSHELQRLASVSRRQRHRRAIVDADVRELRA